MKALKLADASVSPECSIDMLIGSDIYWNFLTGETKRSPGENLAAVNSIFGWLIRGPIECNKQENNKTITLIATYMLKIECYDANDEKGLDENISKFWNLDAIGIKGNQILKVIVSHPILPDNYLLSSKRLNKLKETLNGNRELPKLYDDIFQEQLQAGIIEEVHGEEECGNITYLPYKEAVKDQSSTTKVRIVFNASARLKRQSCLNDILCPEKHIYI